MVRRRWLLGPDVEAGAGNALVAKRFEQRALVVDKAARGGDEKSVRLHQREFAGADHAAIVVGQRTGDRHIIRTTQQFVEFDLLSPTRGNLGRRQIGIVSQHRHSQQALAELGDAAADMTDPDNPDGFALRLGSYQVVAVDTGATPQRAVGLQNPLRQVSSIPSACSATELALPPD